MELFDLAGYGVAPAVGEWEHLPFPVREPVPQFLGGPRAERLSAAAAQQRQESDREEKSVCFHEL